MGLLNSSTFRVCYQTEDPLTAKVNGTYYAAGNTKFLTYTCTTDVSAGVDFNAANKTIIGSYDGAAVATATLVATCANIAAIVTECNTQLDAAFGAGVIVASAVSSKYIKFTAGAGHYFALTGGTAGAVFGYTASAKYGAALSPADNTANWTAMNYPAGPCKLGIPEADLERIRPIGQGAEYVLAFIKGMKYKEFTYVQYIQNQTWLTAIEEAQAGEIPLSYAFHLEIPGVSGVMDYFMIIGAVLTKYKVGNDSNGFPTEELTFTYYDIINDTAITSCTNFSTTQPSTHKDIQCTYTALFSTATKVDVEIELEFEDGFVQGKYQRMDPYIKTRDMKATVEFMDEASHATQGKLLFANNTAPTLVTNVSFVLSTNAATNTLTVTNCGPIEDSIEELEEKNHHKKYRAVIAPMGNSAFTYA